MSQKEDRRIVRTKEAIMEAGVGTLLSNPAAGMSEIAAAAGIGRATLYRHFASREALVAELALRCYQEIDAALEPYQHLAGAAAIEKIIDVVMPMANRYRFLINLWSVVEQDENVLRIEARTQQDMRLMFEAAKQAGHVARDLPTEWLVAFFDATLMAGWMLVESGEADAQAAASYAKRCFLTGCGGAR